MSPEQVRGQSVDKRTDVWGFGCVLYELLTGRRAFPGKTSSDAMAAILEREPDWGVLPAETPTRIRRLLRRCLEKDSKRRLRDIGDARLEMLDGADDERVAPHTVGSATDAAADPGRGLWTADSGGGRAWRIDAPPGTGYA